MVNGYQGNFVFSESVVRNWNSSAIGVYYCGYLNANKKFVTLYIGKGSGENGIRGRLLDHLRDDYWPDVTHFGYRVCTTALEAENLESTEIGNHNPKYNVQGK